MQVSFELKKSEVADGLGIFVLEDVKKGQLVWKNTPGVNSETYDEKGTILYLKTHHIDDSRRFLEVDYGDGDDVVFALDEGAYVNHSSRNYNIGEYPFEEKDISKPTHSHIHSYAIRDISAGEEVFENYDFYDHPDYLLELYERFNTPTSYYKCPPRRNSTNKWDAMEFPGTDSVDEKRVMGVFNKIFPSA